MNTGVIAILVQHQPAFAPTLSASVILRSPPAILPWDPPSEIFSFRSQIRLAFASRAVHHSPLPFLLPIHPRHARADNHFSLPPLLLLLGVDPLASPGIKHGKLQTLHHRREIHIRRFQVHFFWLATLFCAFLTIAIFKYVEEQIFVADTSICSEDINTVIEGLSFFEEPGLILERRDIGVD